jgi:hypothetical protein
MEAQEQRSSKWLKGLVLIFLCVPLSFQFLHWREFTPLNGVQVSEAETFKDSVHGKLDWFSGAFQQHTELVLGEHLVVKSPLVRFRNQVEYSLFGKINAQQIFEYNGNLFRFYSADYNEGTSFIGQKAVCEKVRKLAKIQAFLGETHPIILAIAPSKTYFYAEDLPEVHTRKTDRSNYKAIKQEALKNGIHVIDFNTYFLEQKKIAKAPLISKSGIHWSMYGAALAMDTLIGRIEQLKKSSYSHPSYSLEKTYRFFYNDNDLAQLLNVLAPPNDTDLRCLTFTAQTTRGKKIRALIISDSFFDVVSMTDLRKQLFTPETKFLYYFNTRKDPTNNNQGLKGINLLEEMKNADCIILLSDIVNMENLGWGFIERAYWEIGWDKK